MVRASYKPDLSILIFDRRPSAWADWPLGFYFITASLLFYVAFTGPILIQQIVLYVVVNISLPRGLPGACAFRPRTDLSDITKVVWVGFTIGTKLTISIMKLLLAFVAMLISTVPVLAFDCLSMPGSIRERMPDSKDPRTAVFIGQVRKLDSLNNLAYIYVAETFTGPLPGTLFEVEGLSAESIRYVQGQTYLVEAFRARPDEPWTTTTCSHTRLVNKAADDLVALRAWKKGERVPCNVAGLLWGRDGSEHRSGIGVRLFGKDKTFLAITDREGRFVLKNIPAGTYRIMSNGWVPRLVEITSDLCPGGDLFPARE